MDIPLASSAGWGGRLPPGHAERHATQGLGSASPLARFSARSSIHVIVIVIVIVAVVVGGGVGGGVVMYNFVLVIRQRVALSSTPGLANTPRKKKKKEKLMNKLLLQDVSDGRFDQ